MLPLRSYDTLSKYGLSEHYVDFLRYIEKLTNDKIVVAAIGDYNSGKSYLLNALTNDFDCKNFTVSDSVETKDIKTLEYDNIMFLDTPGFNVDNQDDKNALSGIAQSDLYLFLHSISRGELHQTEVDYLKSIIERYNITSKDIIFLLSKVEGKDEDEKCKIINRIQEQCKEIFDDPITIMDISARNYVKGKKENKEKLIEISNIEKLKETLKDKSKSKKDINATKIAEINDQELFSKMNVLIQEKESQLKQLKENHKKIERKIYFEIEKANETIKQFY